MVVASFAWDVVCWEPSLGGVHCNLKWPRCSILHTDSGASWSPWRSTKPDSEWFQRKGSMLQMRVTASENWPNLNYRGVFFFLSFSEPIPKDNGQFRQANGAQCGEVIWPRHCRYCSELELTQMVGPLSWALIMPHHFHRYNSLIVDKSF